MLRHIRFWKD